MLVVERKLISLQHSANTLYPQLRHACFLWVPYIHGHRWFQVVGCGARTHASPAESTAMTLGTPTLPGAGVLGEATELAAAWFMLICVSVAIAATVPAVVWAATSAVRAVVAAARASLHTMYAATLAVAGTAAAVIAPAAAVSTARAAAVAAF